MKARTKFLVTIFVILSLGLALSLSLLFHYSIQNTKRQAIICNNNFASAIHEAVYVLMKTGQQDSLYEYLDAVRRSGSVNEVRVIRSSVLDREIGVKNTPLQQDDIARQVLSSGQKIVEKTIVESKKAIRTVMPIVAEKSCLTCHSKFKEGQTVAALSTTFIYQSSIDQMIQSLIQNFLMQGLIILLVAGLIFIFFIRLFIHPLERLRKGMDIVAGGDMDHKIGILGHDEISELSESFDLMTAKLKASTTSIEILNKEVSEFAGPGDYLRGRIHLLALVMG